MTSINQQPPRLAEATIAYRNARAEWMERYGTYIAEARIWRIFAFASLAIAIGAISVLIIMTGQNRVVPYIIKTDRLGGTIAIERADLASQPDSIMIKAQLARWITAIRSVYLDASAQRVLIREAYAMINSRSPAYGTLNDHMRAHDPFKRARKETVSVMVASVLPIAKKSWRVEWQETVRGRSGDLISTATYQATISLAFSPPKDEATLRLNPGGLYINDYHWSRRLEPEQGEQS